MNRILVLLIISGITMYSKNSSADCLEDASKFAERICGELKLRGSSSLTEANGQLKADVSGIVKKVVGGGSLTINGKRLQDAYENVLRSDLSKDLSDNRSCRKEMAKAGLAQACKSSPDTPSPTGKRVIEGTSLGIGTPKSAIDNELAKIGASCNWFINKEGAAACSFRFQHRDTPTLWNAAMSGDKIDNLSSEAAFTWGEQENGSRYSPKKSTSGNKAEADRYCTDARLNNFISELVGTFGAPISPPQKTHEDKSSEETNDYCKGRTARSCYSNLTVDAQKYVFRVSQKVMLQFNWKQYSGSRYLETYGDSIFSADWGGCAYRQYIVSEK